MRINALGNTATDFASDDYIAIDGATNASRKMKNDSLLKVTAQNTIKDNFVAEFDESGNTTYVVGTPICRAGKIYTFKVNHSGAWSSSDVELAPDLFFKALTRQIYDGSAYNLANLNDAQVNSFVLIQKTAKTITLNFPTDYPNNKTGLLQTIKGFFSGSSYQIHQNLFNLTDKVLYRRSYNSGNNTWSAWNKTQFTTSSDIETACFVNTNQIYDGRASNLDDLNNATPNTTYVIQRTANTQTLNFPSLYPVSGGGTGFLNTYKAFYDSTHYQLLQTILRCGAGGISCTLYRRSYNSGNNTWGAWATQELQENVIKVGAGQQYTTLRAAFDAAYATTNAKLFVMSGTYDLATEFSDILASITTDVGLSVGNGMHVVFADGAKVTANFVKGDLTDAQWEKLRTYFAPIWCRAGDFVIENMTIEATDCRYCVHDERGQNTTPYVHKFINCKMKKTSTTSDRNYMQCIGGGLGSHGTIIVDGGYYESNPIYGGTNIDSGEPTSAQMCISYHNDGYDSNAESSVTIKNVYFANRGYASILNYGTTTKKTRLYINGCSLGLPVLKTGANSTAVVDNTEVVDWNNILRNQQHWEPINNYQVDLVDDSN